MVSSDKPGAGVMDVYEVTVASARTERDYWQTELELREQLRAAERRADIADGELDLALGRGATE